MAEHRIFSTSFASVYPTYLSKAGRQDRTSEEVDRVIAWLTGYDAAGMKKAIDDEIDMETFFAQAPCMNPKASLITGLISGYRVENIDDPLMQKIRYMDKLVDELSKGRPMTTVLRGDAA
jgi:hypothetical protein